MSDIIGSSGSFGHLIKPEKEIIAKPFKEVVQLPLEIREKKMSKMEH